MSNIKRNAVVSLPSTNALPYNQLTTHVDEKYQVAWGYMCAQPSCFTPALLGDLGAWFNELATQTEKDIRYAVLASEVPGVYNFGGDLSLFKRLIQAKDRDGLLKYATACIDALYIKLIHFRRDITHITLVQGDALGGGFECALASDVLIAERSAKMGLPEILFNLFPGMGAYSLLSRKLDSARAERIILSGRIYGAEELYEMGVVDVLAEDLQGEMAVYDYIRKENRTANGYRALRAAKDKVNPISYKELMDITEIWVDAALRLEPRDLRMMGRLVARQAGRSRSSIDRRQEKFGGSGLR
ncbi:MAG: crotonase/enoyl-CoA hydratase family protein [Gammaproteobacteria bacterium]